MRSYGQYCAVAKSLDVVGDRWTLLIVRELAGRGPSRYTDLRGGLPGIATNLLADRLRELEAAGVITREEAPPPVATTLFSLTARGEELRPILDGLARWGLPLMRDQRPDETVHSEWLAWALRSLLADCAADAPPASIAVQTGDAPFQLRLEGGEIVVAHDGSRPADLTIAGPAMPIMGLLLAKLSVGEAAASGVELTGDASVLKRLRAVGERA
jgi:DNA-binding HxlR family transcriptional regulator